LRGAALDISYFLKYFRPNKLESLSLSIFKKRLFILAAVWLLAFSPGLVLGQAKVQPANTTPEIQDVSYGKHPRNVLDFFPAESESPTPVLIYFHGGGFVAGDKRFVRSQPLVRDCLTNGISVVSANYRFVAGPDSEPFPGSLMDGVRVVQFVRSMAKEWNLDSERIVLSGGSAGALMSLWIALHDEFADTKSADPLVQQSSRVLGVVAYAGPTTIDPRVIVEHVGGNPKIHPSIFPIFNIKKIEELEQPSMREKVEEFSPLSHVSPDDPPLQLRYGGTLAGTPLPENTNVGISIHHARFGDLLRGKYKVVGSKQLVELVCSDCPHADATEIDFLRRVFGLRVQ
jgi:acetyl esterase